MIEGFKQDVRPNGKVVAFEVTDAVAMGAAAKAAVEYAQTHADKGVVLSRDNIDELVQQGDTPESLRGRWSQQWSQRGEREREQRLEEAKKGGGVLIG